MHYKSSKNILFSRTNILKIPLPGENRCELLINVSDDDFFFNILVLGQPFQRSYCHSYNFADYTIGLAKAKHTK